MVTITIDEKNQKIIGVVLAIVIIIGVYLYVSKVSIPTRLEAIKQEGFTNGIQMGYKQALLDVAYTISTKGEVSYIVPTTNITLTLVQKK